MNFALFLLILLVLGVRGCLDARKERAMEDYARRLRLLSQQVMDVDDADRAGVVAG